MLDTLESLFDSDTALRNNPSKKCLATLEDAKRQLGIIPAAPKVPLYRRTYFRVASAAAVIFIALGITFITLRDNGPEPVPHIAELMVETVEDVQKDIYLSDSTRVWVNGNSKLTFPEQFAENGERVVEIEGEARFDVTTDATRSFVVKTQHVEVRVLGTQFDVREVAGTDRTEIVLFEGSVEVTAGNMVEILAPGERLTYSHKTNELNVEAVNTQEVDDWRSDTMFIQGKSLAQIFRMAANYYNVEIVFDENELGGELHSVPIGKDHAIEQMLSALSKASGDFTYYYSENKIYIKTE